VLRTQTVPDHLQRGVSRLFWLFGLMLITNVVLSWYFQHSGDVGHGKDVVFRSAAALTVAEAVDALMVLAAWALYRHEIAPPRGIGSRRRLGWLLGLPVLVGLLIVNVAYHGFLLKLSGAKPEADLLLASGHYRWWLVTLICVQPAIVEELFFRRLTFDFFCNSTSAGTAAFASAMMFAAAHTGGFVSLPYLALFGFCLAWLRWFSGSLVLTMIVHALHNFIISMDDLGFF
jgi:membrane protease YdiL (CAAX protease family)